MAGKNEYVKLWISYDAYFEELGDAEVGRLARAMITYKSTGAAPKFSGNERFIWPAIQRDIDEATKAEQRAAEAHRNAGASGGRPRNQNNQNGFQETNLGQGQRSKDIGQGQGQGQRSDDSITPPAPQGGSSPDFCYRAREAQGFASEKQSDEDLGRFIVEEAQRMRELFAGCGDG